VFHFHPIPLLPLLPLVFWSPPPFSSLLFSSFNKEEKEQRQHPAATITVTTSLPLSKANEEHLVLLAAPLLFVMGKIGQIHRKWNGIEKPPPSVDCSPSPVLAETIARRPPLTMRNHPGPGSFGAVVMMEL
jgi:hypothetical protein